jgi:hypothetical protein
MTIKKEWREYVFRHFIWDICASLFVTENKHTYIISSTQLVYFYRYYVLRETFGWKPNDIITCDYTPAVNFSACATCYHTLSIVRVVITQPFVCCESWAVNCLILHFLDKMLIDHACVTKLLVVAYRDEDKLQHLPALFLQSFIFHLLEDHALLTFFCMHLHFIK